MLLSVPNSLIELRRWHEVAWLIASIAVLVGAVFLLRRFRGTPLILLVIGSAAFVLNSTLQVTLTLLLLYNAHHNTWHSHDWWLRYPEPNLSLIATSCRGIGGIFFSIGFLWYALRATRAS